jgi:hypothetical protein
MQNKHHGRETAFRGNGRNGSRRTGRAPSRWSGRESAAVFFRQVVATKVPLAPFGKNPPEVVPPR